MGRPLNKKYFGNRNVGSLSTHADDGIGGEGIASVTWASLGTFRTTPVGLALPAPTIPGGVQAQWTFQYQVIHVSTGAGKSGLALGDKFAAPSVTSGLIATVVDISGSNAVFAIDAGNGGSAGAPFASIPGGTTVGVTLAKISGSGSAATFAADLDLHITTPVITESGSGYEGNETFTVTVAGGGDPPAGTIHFTTDSGNVGSATNQENAIIIHANTSGGGTTALVGDIIKQVSTRRYKVKTADGIKICALGTTTTPAPYGAYIVATATGGTYYVTKLTAHKATLATKTGDGALDGMAVEWTFGSYTDKIVQIENA